MRRCIFLFFRCYSYLGCRGAIGDEAEKKIRRFTRPKSNATWLYVRVCVKEVTNLIILHVYGSWWVKKKKIQRTEREENGPIIFEKQMTDDNLTRSLKKWRVRKKKKKTKIARLSNAVSGK